MRTRPATVVTTHIPVVAMLLLGIAGCGQKGPLVPPKADTVTSSVVNTISATHTVG